MDCSLPGSSIHGILQARVLEWGAIDLSQFCWRNSKRPSREPAEHMPSPLQQVWPGCWPWPRQCQRLQGLFHLVLMGFDVHSEYQWVVVFYFLHGDSVVRGRLRGTWWWPSGRPCFSGVGGALPRIFGLQKVGDIGISLFLCLWMLFNTAFLAFNMRFSLWFPFLFDSVLKIQHFWLLIGLSKMHNHTLFSPQGRLICSCRFQDHLNPPWKFDPSKQTDALRKQ